MFKTKLLLLLLALSPFSLSAQLLYVHSNLPPILQANAGMDNFIDVGDSVQLGGNPSAWDGYGDYIYLWEPVTGLDDPTLSNPWARPDTITVYLLTVSDGHNCLGMDQATIKVGASGIDDLSSTHEVSIYPNPAVHSVNVSIHGINGGVKLRICNNFAQTMVEVTAIIHEHHLFCIDIHTWKKGVYYVSLQSEKHIRTQILVVL